MIYLLLDKEIVSLYPGTDEVYQSMGRFKRKRLDQLMKKTIRLLPWSRSVKLVCDEDTISYTLKVARLFEKPVIIMKDYDQYLSTSDFWSDYVCFK